MSESDFVSPSQLPYLKLNYYMEVYAIYKKRGSTILDSYDSEKMSTERKAREQQQAALQAVWLHYKIIIEALQRYTKSEADVKICVSVLVRQKHFQNRKEIFKNNEVRKILVDELQMYFISRRYPIFHYGKH